MHIFACMNTKGHMWHKHWYIINVNEHVSNVSPPATIGTIESPRQAWSVAYCKLRPHDMPQVFKSILPIGWNIHFRVRVSPARWWAWGLPVGQPASRFPLQVRYPKTVERPVTELDASASPAGSCGTGAVERSHGDPYPFWCTIYIGWFNIAIENGHL